MQLKMSLNVKVTPFELVDEMKNEYTENKDFSKKKKEVFKKFPNENFNKLFMKLLENVPIKMDTILCRQYLSSQYVFI